MGVMVQLRNTNYEVEMCFATAPTAREIAAVLREAAWRLERYGREEPETAQLRARDGRLLMEAFMMPREALLP